MGPKSQSRDLKSLQGKLESSGSPRSRLVAVQWHGNWLVMDLKGCQFLLFLCLLETQGPKLQRQPAVKPPVQHDHWVTIQRRTCRLSTDHIKFRRRRCQRPRLIVSAFSGLFKMFSIWHSSLNRGDDKKPGATNGRQLRSLAAGEIDAVGPPASYTVCFLHLVPGWAR